MKVERSSTTRPAPTTPALCSGMGVALALASLPVLAQSASSSTPQLFISTFFTASETYYDTQRARGYSGGEFVTELTPAVRISGRLGPVEGSFDYSLSALHYSEGSQANGIVSNARNGLNTAFTITPLDNFAFIDVRAGITQQSLTPFGEQSVPGSSRPNSNLTEVYEVSVSPYVRGSVSGLAEYTARLRAASTNAQNSVSSDSTTVDASFALNSTGGGVLGWGLSASRQRVDYRATGTTGTGRVDATIRGSPSPDLQLTANAGRETTDVVGGVKRTYDVHGFGARWTPSERTNVDFKTDQRYFGRSWNLGLGYRTARTVWRYSNVKDAIDGGGPSGVGRPLTLYDLYFNQFASVMPDPVQRERLVLDYLRSIGANPGASVGGGFLVETKTLQNRQDLSFAYQGQRASFNLLAYGNDNRAIDKTTNQATGDPVVTRGYLGTLSYRLTPVSSLSLTGNQTKTLSNQSNSGNDLKSVSLNWSSQPSRRTTVSAGAGYTVFDREVDGYHESFVRASISLQF
jgi:uncharacterized protein (PEP-CTERM system associated)